jgi:protein subunit release factor A
MDPKDLRIDSFSHGTNGNESVSMQITHIPSGVSVNGEGQVKTKLREQLVAELEQKIKELP